MNIFINEFMLKEVPTKLSLYKVRISELDTLERNYRIPAIAGRTLSKELKEPVSSFGDTLISAPKNTLPHEFEMQIKHEGFPKTFHLKIENPREVKPKDLEFSEVAKRYLNRKIDCIMENEGYAQEGRFFFSSQRIRLAASFYLLRGIFISTKSYPNGRFTIVSDSAVRLKSGTNLLEDLNRVLERLGIDSWRNVGSKEKQINAIFWSRAPRLRTIYSEIRGFGEPGHGSYRFRGFDFNRSVTDSVDGQISPFEWHKKFGRNVSPEQPIVKVVASGPFKVDQVPELLEEQPSFEKLKRIFQTSREAHTRALLSSLDRLLATSDALQPLVRADLIEESPIIKDAKNYAPVELDIGGDFIKISRNRDFFTKYFEKRRLLKHPEIERIYAITTEKEIKETKKLLDCEKSIASDFGLNLPEAEIHSTSEEEIVTSLIDLAKDDSFSRKDLVYIVSGLGESEYESFEEDPYFTIKKYSLSEQIFPTQFVDLKTIQSAKNLEVEVGRQVFIQIISKCNGQPWGLAPDFAPENFLFIALDNYRDPFGRTQFKGASASIFDWRGVYLWSEATPYIDEDWISVTTNILQDSLKKCNGAYDGIIFLRDSKRFGRDPLEVEIQRLNDICTYQGFDLEKLIHVQANKSSHYRIFTSGGRDILSAGTAPPLTAVLDMEDPTTFLIASTEPIFSMKSQREMGTPRPVLYRISSPPEAIEIKNEIAKALSWLCRHSWCSPVFMRIPAPLMYANKISSLVAKMGARLSQSAGDAPLYL